MNSKNLPSKIVTFLKEVRLEVKKINWPSREQAIKYTLIVIGVSLITAMFLGGFDFIFTTLLNWFIVR